MRYLSSFVSSAALTACVVFLGAGCTQMSQTSPQIPNQTSTSTIPTPTPTSTLPVPTYPEVQPVVRARPSGMVCDTKNFICAPSTLVNSHVQSPVVATGTAIAFESTFQWKLLGPGNQLIAQGTLMANAPDIGQPGLFTLSQAVTIPAGYTTGTLRFYEASAQDGSAIHLLNIPVTF